MSCACTVYYHNAFASLRNCVRSVVCAAYSLRLTRVLWATAHLYRFGYTNYDYVLTVDAVRYHFAYTNTNIVNNKNNKRLHRRRRRPRRQQSMLCRNVFFSSGNRITYYYRSSLRVALRPSRNCINISAQNIFRAQFGYGIFGHKIRRPPSLPKQCEGTRFFCFC